LPFFMSFLRWLLTVQELAEIRGFVNMEGKRKAPECDLRGHRESDEELKGLDQVHFVPVPPGHKQDYEFGIIFQSEGISILS
jgi:hypothetical protein